MLFYGLEPEFGIAKPNAKKLFACINQCIEPISREYSKFNPTSYTVRTEEYLETTYVKIENSCS